MMRRRHHHARHRRRHGPGMTLRGVVFAGFFVAILATAGVVMATMAVTAGPQSWWREMQRFQQFASSQLARAWDDPDARTRLLADAARDLEARIVVVDDAGREVFVGGTPGDCGHFAFTFDIARNGAKLGTLTACRPGEHAPPWRAAVAIALAVIVLQAISGVFARQAARPLVHLVDVANRIGDGDLRARPTLRRHTPLEIRALGSALGDMAERIEAQLRDQRALLAGASHEMRTPLGHLRILVELLKDGAPAVRDKAVADVEREVVEMDALIEKLLASSRLDFAMAEKRDVDGADLARRALERAGEPADKLIVGAGDVALKGDPTLLLGALGNLIENAKTHGVGVVRIVVEPRADEIAFVVDDKGAGIAPQDEERAFEPFFHKGAQGSLGLGLSLVRRIAQAHGGRAWATHAEGGGGRVGFTVARG